MELLIALALLSRVLGARVPASAARGRLSSASFRSLSLSEKSLVLAVFALAAGLIYMLYLLFSPSEEALLAGEIYDSKEHEALPEAHAPPDEWIRIFGKTRGDQLFIHVHTKNDLPCCYDKLFIENIGRLCSKSFWIEQLREATKNPCSGSLYLGTLVQILGCRKVGGLAAAHLPADKAGDIVRLLARVMKNEPPLGLRSYWLDRHLIGLAKMPDRWHTWDYTEDNFRPKLFRYIVEHYPIVPLPDESSDLVDWLRAFQKSPRIYEQIVVDALPIDKLVLRDPRLQHLASYIYWRRQIFQALNEETQTVDMIKIKIVSEIINPYRTAYLCAMTFHDDLLYGVLKELLPDDKDIVNHIN